MMRHEASRRETSAIGLFLALLALVSQLALGAMVLPDAPAAGDQAFDAIAVMCLAGTPADHHNAPHPHPATHTLCPLCGTMVLQATLPDGAPALTAPSSHALAQSSLPPPAQGPPTQLRRTDLPRGPPVLT